MADIPTNHKIGRSFFDDDHNLWIDFNGVIPPELLINHSNLFMIEHDDPCRTMINLTAYIALIHDIRKF